MKAPMASMAKKAIFHASQPVLTSSIIGKMLIRARIAKTDSKNFNGESVFGVSFLTDLIR